MKRIEPLNTEEALFVEFTEIVRARSPEAWQLLHVGTVKELVRVAVKRLSASAGGQEGKEPKSESPTKAHP